MAELCSPTNKHSKPGALSHFKSQFVSGKKKDFCNVVETLSIYIKTNK